MNQRVVQVLSYLKELDKYKQKLGQRCLKNEPTAVHNSSRLQESISKKRQSNQRLMDLQNSIKQMRSVTHHSLQSIDQKLALQNSLINNKKIENLQERVRQLQSENAILREKLTEAEGKETQFLKKQAQCKRKIEERSHYYKQRFNKIQSSLKQMKKEFGSMQAQIEQGLKNFSFDPTLLLIKEKMHALRGEAGSRDLEINNLKKSIESLSGLNEEVQRACSAISENTGIPLPKTPLTKSFSPFVDALLRELSISRFLCESEIVTDKPTKIWLLQHVKNEMNFRESVSSKLLYRYWAGEPSKVNFHEYIDNRPNILVLVRLTNCYILGAFTEFPFKKNQIVKPGNGFLFNATFQSFYPMRKDPVHAVAGYDGYYIIFGNSELRLKSLDLKLFSNFGISQGTFVTNGHKRTDFMGTASFDETETDINSFEVHQIL